MRSIEELEVDLKEMTVCRDGYRLQVSELERQRKELLAERDGLREALDDLVGNLSGYQAFGVFTSATWHCIDNARAALDQKPFGHCAKCGAEYLNAVSNDPLCADCGEGK